MSAIHWYLGNRLALRRGPYFHVRVLWFAVERLPSWANTQYPRFQFWFRYAGFTLRWRDWLVLFR